MSCNFTIHIFSHYKIFKDVLRLQPVKYITGCNCLMGIDIPVTPDSPPTVNSVFCCFTWGLAKYSVHDVKMLVYFTKIISNLSYKLRYETAYILNINKIGGLIEQFLVPALHNWCNKGHGMCYPVCGMVHIKEPLLLIRKSSPCGSNRFPLSLSEWSFTNVQRHIAINKMC